MPDERTRALLWAGGFLVELARNDSLPLDVRRRAVVIARHFPTIEDVSAMALFRHPSGLGIGLASPSDVSSRNEGGCFGPLRYATRLAWPEEV
ncbi:BPSL0761 family protein [Frateuria sp. GZRe14]|uniref:BPSL0761 family protein n=1 Tax=Frateuria sp. GZRe14 TaxID=3351534 RepID=UPI003EDC3A0B